MTWAQQTALGYGLLGFLIVWGIVLAIQVSTQRARYGRVRTRSIVVSGAVTLYACLAVAVVLLPLPGPNTPALEQTVQLVPFQWVADIGTELAKYDQPGSAALFTQTFQQVAMNVLLFVPLGIFAKVLWNQRASRAVLWGFGASLLIELTQITANFGTAPMVYRIFDIDDLMTNTSGALLGWVAAALFLTLRHMAQDVSPEDAVPAQQATVPTPAGRAHQVWPAAPVFAAHDAVPHGGLPALPWHPRR
ncbi:VanZ family protein [Prauserella cavernicola]|uniref:VanZ family protein n=1 Tax=Prauserella cavernicola TaxID=2800127 RepID=A0A934V3T5_9PSEU|nr:VanZ family protein [Prauserella cavernicola]MBK1784707.1 VanZ family protein [Prauserella cavernicola]